MPPRYAAIYKAQLVLLIAAKFPLYHMALVRNFLLLLAVCPSGSQMVRG